MARLIPNSSDSNDVLAQRARREAARQEPAFSDELHGRIMQAVKILAQNPKTVAEPSGAVAPAAWLFHRDLLPASNHTVAVISGGNIDPGLLSRIRG